MQRTPPHCGWRFFIPMSAAWGLHPSSAIRVYAPRTTATAAATTDSEPAARTERKPPRACIRQPDRMCSCIFPYRRLPLPHRQRYRIARRKNSCTPRRHNGRTAAHPTTKRTSAQRLRHLRPCGVFINNRPNYSFRQLFNRFSTRFRPFVDNFINIVVDNSDRHIGTQRMRNGQRGVGNVGG